MTDKFRERARNIIQSTWVERVSSDESVDEILFKKIAQALAEVDAEATERAAKIVDAHQSNWADNDRTTNAYYNLEMAAKFIRSQPDPTKEEG